MRFAARTPAAHLRFHGGRLLILGLGIGANTAIFRVITACC